MESEPIPATVAWMDGRVRLIDQRRLPGRLQFLSCGTVDEVCDAISSLAVRGAPALGATGGYGVALAV
ncbi:MAG: S-methyl-5-thioribose-1-phosphate isomerase, partial [Acidimicrobiia bacterium]